MLPPSLMVFFSFTAFQHFPPGSWHHLYGMCRSCKDNRSQRRLLRSRSQSLLPLRRRHHLHRHPHLDLLLSASSERYDKGELLYLTIQLVAHLNDLSIDHCTSWLCVCEIGEAAVHVHDAGGDLHVGGDGGVHHRLDRDLVRVRLVHHQPQDQQHHMWRQGGGGGE